jgi:hypothetical protein
MLRTTAAADWRAKRTRRDPAGTAAGTLLYVVLDEITIIEWVDIWSSELPSRTDPPAADHNHIEPSDGVRARRRSTQATADDEFMNRGPG